MPRTGWCKPSRSLATGSSRRGSNAEVRKFVGKSTKLIDLKGHFVSPGLTDDHFHNEGGGTGIDLSHVRTMAELLTTVANATAGTAPGALLVSNSDWHEAQLKEQRLPTAKELDQAAPNNPVVLVRGGHSYILSNSAFKKYNITKDTPVPAGGQISRGTDGELTGELFDNAKTLVPLPPEKPLTMEDIVATQKAVNPYGMTAVRIPGSYKGDMLQALRLWKEAEVNHTLTLRYTVYMPGFAFRTPQQVDQTIAKWGVKQDEGDDFVRIGGIKLIVDGGFEGGHISRPYQEPYGRGGTYSGLTVSPPDAYNSVVMEINRQGWRATTHRGWRCGHGPGDHRLRIGEQGQAPDRQALGDRACLHRPTRSHQADAGPEIDGLGAGSPLPRCACSEEILGLGSGQRSDAGEGLSRCRAAGGGGTDSPVIPFNPFWELYHFASRDTISDGVYGADQKIASRALLLRLDTINYAKLIGEDDHRGSIEPVSWRISRCSPMISSPCRSRKSRT